LRQTEIEPIDRIILRVSYDSNEIKKEIENQINKSNEEFREIQDDLSSNLDSQHETEITETLLSVNSSMEELINQLELLKINVNSLKKDILSTIREEIKEKLGEYFYFENSLFPDLDKYISYIQASYINNDENSKLEVAEFAENKE
ncbi:hypothetical protein L1T96_001639, partial [Enterococcus faecalis]|nr:hypothetical protein [Enterococcus faecalis]